MKKQKIASLSSELQRLENIVVESYELIFTAKRLIKKTHDELIELGEINL